MQTHTTFLATLALVLMMAAVGFTQEFTLTVNSGTYDLIDGTGICLDEVDQFEIAVTGSGDAVYELKLVAEDNDHLGIFTEAVSLTVTGELEGYSDLRGHAYQILDLSENAILSFGILAPEGSVQDSANTRRTEQVAPIDSASEWIEKYHELTYTPYGLQVNNTSGCFNGNEFTHIFLDQYGNSLVTTIPQGIANRQYVVHVVFLTPADNASTQTYSVIQSTGEFQDTPVFLGENGEVWVSSAKTVGRASRYSWTETITALNTSTSDIQFELIQSTYSSLDDTLSGSTERIATRTIRMTPVYAGSFDIGILNSTLSNPEYSLVSLPGDSIQTTVKVSDEGNQVVVTAMLTLYSSPVVWLQRLFGGDIPKYKCFGRNFLDDHEWYQKFFPALGISIGSSSLENLFLGLNFEFARGCNLFGGLHYGKVSIFDFPDGFIPGQTPMSAGEFSILHNDEWESGIALGLILDVGIITNLIGE